MRRIKLLGVMAVSGLLGAASAASPATASVPFTATVADACMITSSAPVITLDYQAASTTASVGNSQVLVVCNRDTAPFAGYWDDTGFNPDGSIDLLDAGNHKLNVTLATDFDYTDTGYAANGGSSYSYGISATAKAGQWAAPSGSYTKTVDYLVGW
ncbi:hypothetical protein D3875_04270 [Deinococcus cavernae]|uniref:Spore coat protein U domain-containing protein n=1 Tax=Deinococcus cavernae TaxID=2320857 RepID=A0A418VEG6_9DEIO|nr:hypothetical protein [Deinococcus cavernae]RJF74502.1 hypothetical protein D3875_04270 [Deinococcus cavernae]